MDHSHARPGFWAQLTATRLVQIAIGLLVIGMVVAVGISFSSDKATIAKTLAMFGATMLGLMLGYALAIVGRSKVLAQIGDRSVAVELAGIGEAPGDQELLAELHDFATHVLRYRQIPQWRQATATPAPADTPVPAAPAPRPAAAPVPPPVVQAKAPAPAPALVCSFCQDEGKTTPGKVWIDPNTGDPMPEFVMCEDHAKKFSLVPVGA